MNAFGPRCSKFDVHSGMDNSSSTALSASLVARKGEPTSTSTSNDRHSAVGDVSGVVFLSAGRRRRRHKLSSLGRLLSDEIEDSAPWCALSWQTVVGLLRSSCRSMEKS